MTDVTLSEKQALVLSYLMKQRSSPIPPTVREICNATGIRSTSTVHSAIAFLSENGFIVKDKHSSRSVRIANTDTAALVPVLGKVTAGDPILAFEDIEEYIPYPVSAEHSDSIFALKVRGLSMKNAGILNGDIIVADKSLQSRDGDIVVALIADEATVKRLVLKQGEKPYLLPENPDFEPIRPEKMEILGKVIGSFRRY